MKTALIFGALGQDGFYLTQLLLSRGYKVVALMRKQDDRIESFQRKSLFCRELTDCGVSVSNLVTDECDVGDADNILECLQTYVPDQVYNLASQSSVARSFGNALVSVDVNGVAVLRILEAIRIVDGHNSRTKFFQASSSEIYGRKSKIVNEESTPSPISPYGLSKLMAHQAVQVYREAYGMFACNGIFFNHESERRPQHFLSRKISSSVARIAAGSKSSIAVGNLDSKRDWGYARDYMQVPLKILEMSSPNDYVIGTGIVHSVRELIVHAFRNIGVELLWIGEGVKEIAIAKDAPITRRLGISGKTVVETDPSLYRPLDSGALIADSARAHRELGWRPQINFEKLVDIMVQSDLMMELN